MAQRLAANQHGGLVQFSPGLILATGVYLALVTPPRAAVNLVIRDVLDGPGIGLVDGRGILRPVAVDVGAGVDVLPDLFLCRRVRDPLHDLIRVLANDRTETLPSALAVANMDKGLRLRKQLRVPEDLKTPRDARRLLRLGDLLQLGKLCFDLLPGNQILSPQLLQFSSPQAGPAAKFYQFIIVRL